jgi:hypothetical protein
VTRAAWQDAREKAATKRPPRRKRATKSGATDVSREKPRDDLDSEWQRKGATLSDKTARKEFGLTQEEIVRAIRAGTLRYRLNSVFGNLSLPFNHPGCSSRPRGTVGGWRSGAPPLAERGH